MGGGWGGEIAKIKIEQGKQKEKKFVHQKSLKKKFVQRLFNNYGKLYVEIKNKFVQGITFKKIIDTSKKF
jgi:hypothetical protein